MGTPPSPEGSAPQGKKELAAAYEALVSAAAAKDAERLRPGPAPRRTRWALLALALLVAGAVGAYLSLCCPPEGLGPARPAQRRAQMVVLGRRIAGFQTEHGRLPRALREIGPTPPGIDYRIIDAETWELTAVGGGDTIRLRAGQNAAPFLADSSSREPRRP